jgi:hypothetical protein
MSDQQPTTHNQPPIAPPPVQSPPEVASARDAYNVVTDTIMGPNIRLRDNLLQGAAILIFAVIGAVIGAIFIEDRLAGLLVGAVGGLIAGLFISGIGLMIYRGVRHMRGKHD